MNVAVTVGNTRMFALDVSCDWIDVCSVDFTTGDRNGHVFRIGNGIGSLGVHVVKSDAATEKSVNATTTDQNGSGSDIGSGLDKRPTVANLSRRIGEPTSCEENVFSTADDKVHLIDVGVRIRLIGSLGGISLVVSDSQPTSRSSDVVAALEVHGDGINIASGRHSAIALIGNKVTAGKGNAAAEVAGVNTIHIHAASKTGKVFNKLREILGRDVRLELAKIGVRSLMQLGLVVVS